MVVSEGRWRQVGVSGESKWCQVGIGGRRTWLLVASRRKVLTDFGECFQLE